MEEKRRFKRVKANLNLNVSALFKQDNVQINNVDSPINVVDVSRSGIGFISAATLPVGFYFNAALELGSHDDILYCVVKIVRCRPVEGTDTYSYGCEFVGLPNVLMYIFDEFEASAEEV